MSVFIDCSRVNCALQRYLSIFKVGMRGPGGIGCMLDCRAKPAYNAVARDRNVFFRCRQIPFHTGNCRLHSHYCKHFLLKIGFRNEQVPFKTVYSFHCICISEGY